MSGYIIDNSGWSNAFFFDPVYEAIENLQDVVYSCPPQRLEFLYSAQSADDYSNRLALLATNTIEVDRHDEVGGIAEDMQQALMAKGILRAVGVVDLLVAAYAYLHKLTVLHYDSDYERLSAVYPGLQSEWIVPRGSLKEIV